MLINNDILRRIRYIFDYSDTQMIAIFAQAEVDVSRTMVSSWLKSEEDEGYSNCSDTQLAIFLNGLINKNRGKREGGQAKPEKRLNNNVILRKLKIALALTSEDVMAVMAFADLPISQHELSAFFRRPDHKHYRVCKDQILRNFLLGLQYKHRPANVSQQGNNNIWKTSK